jgi:hypothetical protein
MTIAIVLTIAGILLFVLRYRETMRNRRAL